MTLSYTHRCELKVVPETPTSCYSVVVNVLLVLTTATDCLSSHTSYLKAQESIVCPVYLYRYGLLLFKAEWSLYLPCSIITDTKQCIWYIPLFWPKREKVTGDRTKLYNEDLHDFYPLAGVITVTISRMMVVCGSLSTCERNGKLCLATVTESWQV